MYRTNKALHLTFARHRGGLFWFPMLFIKLCFDFSKQPKLVGVMNGQINV